MKRTLILFLCLTSSSVLLASTEAEKLAVKKCTPCHIMGTMSKEKIKKMSAPPYWAIAKKAGEKYSNRADMIKYIVDFTLNPATEKMLFPKATIDKFGLMPSQKGIVTEDEAKQIAEYILGE